MTAFFRWGGVGGFFRETAVETFSERPADGSYGTKTEAGVQKICGDGV